MTRVTSESEILGLIAMIAWYCIRSDVVVMGERILAKISDFHSFRLTT